MGEVIKGQEEAEEINQRSEIKIINPPVNFLFQATAVFCSKASFSIFKISFRIKGFEI